MWHRTNESGDTRIEHMSPDPLRKMRRRLAWALSAATVALVINAVAVVILVHPVQKDANVNGKPTLYSPSKTILGGGKQKYAGV